MSTFFQRRDDTAEFPVFLALLDAGALVIWAVLSLTRSWDADARNKSIVVLILINLAFAFYSPSIGMWGYFLSCAAGLISTLPRFN